MDFYSVWIGSPDGCETAIVKAREEYWIVNLLDAMQIPNKRSGIGADFYVGTYMAFPEKNAAIMAALMMRS